MTNILIKTGLSTALPGPSSTAVTSRELFFTTDSNKLYFRNGTANIMINPFVGIEDVVNQIISYNTANTSPRLPFVRLAGDTMTGALILSGTPTIDLHAATKKYVDDQVSTVAITAAGGMRYIDSWNGSQTIQQNITAAYTVGNAPDGQIRRGDVFTVTVAGTGAAFVSPNGDNLKVGDVLIYKGTNKPISQGSTVVVGDFTVVDNTSGTLNTNNEDPLLVNGGETFGGGEIKLHKVAKTGTYSDLKGLPTITPFTGTLITTETPHAKIITATNLNAAIALHDIARTGSWLDLLNKPTFTFALGGSNTSPTISWNDGGTAKVITLAGGGGTTFTVSGQTLTITAPAPDEAVPANDGILTITQNGVSVATFTADQAGNSTAAIAAADWTAAANTAGEIKNKPTIAALASTAPAIIKGQTAAQGVGTTAARADHIHDLATASTTDKGGIKVDGTYVKVISDVVQIAIIDGGTF